MKKIAIRSLAPVLAVAPLIALAASAAAPADAAVRQPAAFNSATATDVHHGTFQVRWNALPGERVSVFTGSGPTARTLIAAGGASGHLTVNAIPGAARTYVRLVPTRGHSLVIAPRDLGLASDPNLRDIGGYRTGDGHWVRSGIVYRSQQLTLSAADLATVDKLGLTHDYDLRTPAEVAATADTVPAGAKYTDLNLLGTGTTPAFSTVTDAASAQRYMRTIERDFVTEPTSRTALADLYKGIATSRGSVLYHCTAGKDRTGWATGVLLTWLGVPQKQVVNDYQLSHTYYFDSPATQAFLAKTPAAQRAIFTHIYDVEPSYLLAGLAQIHQSYGTLDNFMHRGLGLSHQQLKQLRHRMLTN